MLNIKNGVTPARSRFAYEVGADTAIGHVQWHVLVIEIVSNGRDVE